MTRVAISGVSSYTGMCIARAFAESGYETTGILSSPLGSYSGRKRARLELSMASGVKLAPELPAQGGKMASWLAKQDFALWVHHHHPMENFRAPNYDLESARLAALHPLLDLASAWERAGVRAVLASSTYFEPGEGGLHAPQARTPYAQLKAEVSAQLEELCQARGLGFAKIVISSPTGALENEDRLTPQMLLAATRGEPLLIRSPDSVFDNISGEALAAVYLETATHLLSTQEPTSLVVRPSSFVVSAAQWAVWVNENVARHLGLELEVHFPSEDDRPRPSHFQNPATEHVRLDWAAIGAQYAADWRRYYPIR